MKARTVVLVLSLVVAAAALSPVIQLAYATSGSMEPAIPTDAVYVVHSMNDSPEEGDIVMYHSADQGRVTHRVVEVTESGGYITQGDANERPDQTAPDEAVTSEQVIGVVPTLFGRPAVVPGSGTAVGFVRTSPAVALLAVWLLVGAGYILSSGGGERLAVREVVVPLLAVSFVVSVAFVSMGAGYETELLATGGPHEEDPELVPAGESSVQTFSLSTTPPVPQATAVVSTSGPTRVVGVEDGDGHKNVSVAVPSYPKGHLVEERIVVNYYPPVLPASTLAALHRVHPVVAAAVTTGICYLPVYLLYQVLVDPRKLLRPPLERGEPR